ncbi:uncharacterized protein DS421_17g580340 [Arachis hypogaea]|nr:uncharacterized protein DS421_17g580340 [Arachis hypogaea]
MARSRLSDSKIFIAHENEFLEGRKGPSDKVEVIISERHTLQVKLLEQRVGIGKCGVIRREVGTSFKWYLKVNFHVLECWIGGNR